MHRQALPSNRAKGLRPHKGLHDAHHGRLRGRPCRASLPGGLTNPGFGRPCRATHPGLWGGIAPLGLAQPLGFVRAHNSEALQGRSMERLFSTKRPLYPCVVRGEVMPL